MKKYIDKVISKVTDLNVYRKEFLFSLLVDYLINTILSLLVVSGIPFSISPLLAVAILIVCIGIFIHACFRTFFIH
jgi:hypothetical protein